MEVRARSGNKKTKVQMQKSSKLWMPIRSRKAKTAKKVSIFHLPEVRLKYVYLQASL